jgi:MoaA/NifB/PqqE/SkfB family radical SAM enzyme
MSINREIYWTLKKKQYALEKNIHELKHLSVEITNACNLHCKHCYMNSVAEISDKCLSSKEWIDFFKKLKNDFGKNIYIGISGGEPLLRKDIFDILQSLKDLKLKTSLVTNGVLLDKQKVTQLNNLIESISISLDGFSDSHNYLRNENVYEKVLENIKMAIDDKTKYLVIKTTVYKKNIKDLDAFYEFLVGLGVSEWHVFPMEQLGRGKENQKELLSANEYEKLYSFIDKVRKNKKMRIRFGEEADYFMVDKTCDCNKYKLCSAGISSCAILYNGNIVNCIQENRSNLKPQGNIRDNDFKNVWKNKFLEHRDDQYRYCNNHKLLSS